MKKHLGAAVVGIVVCFLLSITTYANEISHSGTCGVVEARPGWSEGVVRRDAGDFESITLKPSGGFELQA